jgi:hypothetical protein
MTKISPYHDSDGTPIPYGALLDFIWWAFDGTEVELHYKARIRHRKSGDIFEFVEDDNGRPCHFTHRLTELNWCEDDLLLIKEDKQ